MKIVIAISCVFALCIAFPVKDNNSMKFHSIIPHRTDNLNTAHKRNVREISDYYFGADTYPTYTYPYPVPSNPYYEYDAQEGIWKPKCKNLINSNYAFNGYVEPSPPRYRSRANRRQGYNGGYVRPGHSATFEALRGAIAFG